jgi:hypothetical protein
MANRWWQSCHPYALAALYPQVSLFSLSPFNSYYSFLLEAELTPRAIVRLEGLGKFEKIHLLGTLSHNLPARSIVPQPLRYHVQGLGSGMLKHE